MLGASNSPSWKVTDGRKNLCAPRKLSAIEYEEHEVGAQHAAPLHKPFVSGACPEFSRRVRFVVNKCLYAQHDQLMQAGSER